MDTEDTCCSTDKPSQCCGDKSAHSCCDKLALIYGALLLRLWLAVRAIQTGVEKFAGTNLTDQAVNVDGVPNAQGLTASEAVKEYALSHYHGVPAALMKKFEAEPIMMKMKFALPLYDKILGPALLVLGIMILLGIASRTSLFLLGLLYISLTWGLILIKQDDGVSWLGVHMILIALALMLSAHNRFAILKKW
jgi:thiosulfate dehydrogenase [quinone] large subunit